MAGLSFTWILRHQGWAFCTIADDQGQAEAICSYITGGPEQLIKAATILALTNTATRAEFEAEPTVFRWFFEPANSHVDIRLVQAADSDSPDDDGAVIWSSRQPISSLAQAVLEGFEHAVQDLGEDNYAAQWGRPYPRTELVALKNAIERISPDINN